MSSFVPDANRGHRWLALILWLGLVFAVALAGSTVTLPKILTWYASLNKPPFNPPNWIFGPVWTLLYAMMAVAIWRATGASAPADLRRRATWLFIAQLALNGLWSQIFFGLERPDLALAVILALLLVLALTAIAFFRLDRIAGLLLGPYLAWVAFATALNGAIVILN